MMLSPQCARPFDIYQLTSRPLNTHHLLSVTLLSHTVCTRILDNHLIGFSLSVTPAHNFAAHLVPSPTSLQFTWYLLPLSFLSLGTRIPSTYPLMSPLSKPSDRMHPSDIYTLDTFACDLLFWYPLDTRPLSTAGHLLPAHSTPPE